MKRLTAFSLAAVLALSLAACGGGEDAAGGGGMTEEEMLEAAEHIDTSCLARDTYENAAKAQETYCGQILEVTGVVDQIETDHVQLAVNGVCVDLFFPTEEFTELTSNQQITVVGRMGEELTGGPVEYHYTMSEGYVTADRFEVSGALHGPNSSDSSAYNFDDGTPYLKLVYFQDGVDVSSIDGDVRLSGKLIQKNVMGVDSYEIQDAVIVE